jgi:tetratricopeptide (TPR) repeat protein
MKRSMLVLILLCVVSVAPAEEGMWVPQQLPGFQTELQELGLTVDASQLADLNSEPLAAVVWLGGCSAAFVSNQGLVVTNHHCAYGTIHFNSTTEHDYLHDGFLAPSFADELPASPGSRIWVAVGTKDVTEQIQAAIPKDAAGLDRFKAIEAAEKSLVKDCEKDPGHRCRVSGYYGGSQYVLTKQMEIRDVRLVYAPAESVGNYGGDIDNWMWPRHTGDFSFLRAYVGPDGRTADPSPDNVPYQPEHWLRLAPEGVSEDDFVMVAGYPGSTDRYRLADEVEFTFEWAYPERIKMLERLLEIIDRETEGRPEAALAYTAVARYINNGLKNNQGMLAGYAHSDMLARKRALEAGMEEWINANPDRRDRWGSVLADMRRLIEEEQATKDRDLVMSRLKRGTLVSPARTLVRLAHEREVEDADRQPGFQDRDMAKLEAGLRRFQRSFDVQVDRAFLKEVLKKAAALPEQQRITALDRFFALDPYDETEVDEKLDQIYAQTEISTQDVRLEFVGATIADLEKADDPMLDLALALLPEELAWERAQEDLEGRMLLIRPQLMQAMVAYLESQGRHMYPDANSTLRVTYGTVQGYSPRDGILYSPFTSDRGLLEKETGTAPFASSAQLLLAVADGEFGPYATAKGRLPVNFLSTVDTTGGNSGSPTLDGQGRLVGLLFDGNWESIIADWDYLPPVTRSIHTDVRFMLWVMDRIDGAWNLMREMGIEPAFAPSSFSGDGDRG